MRPFYGPQLELAWVQDHTLHFCKLSCTPALVYHALLLQVYGICSRCNMTAPRCYPTSRRRSASRERASPGGRCPAVFKGDFRPECRRPRVDSNHPSPMVSSCDVICISLSFVALGLISLHLAVLCCFGAYLAHLAASRCISLSVWFTKSGEHHARRTARRCEVLDAARPDAIDRGLSLFRVWGLKAACRRQGPMVQSRTGRGRCEFGVRHNGSDTIPGV